MVMQVDAYALARRLEITAPSERILRRLDDFIADAVADVEGFLNQPITPVTVTDASRYPWPSGWDLTQPPAREIVSTVAETDVNGQATGYFTVTYTVGLDWVNDPDLEPIRRYVMAAAQNTPAAIRLWLASTGYRGPVRSVSTEGQSVTYGAETLGGTKGAEIGTPGALPSTKSIEKWKRRTVSQPPTRVHIGGLGWGDWMRP
jgi:hypothetical protein